MAYTKTQWNPGGPPAVNAENLNKIEQGIYDAHVTADAAVKKSGDTMTGVLVFDNGQADTPEILFRDPINNTFVYMDLFNETFRSFGQYRNNGTVIFPFEFDMNAKTMRIFGNIAWHSGNDGAGSGLDADKVKGKNITVSSTAPSNPQVNDIWIQV